ncbi:putative kinase [Saccharothrix longispora]|uniref:Kinase n=1 Tax=Saccharothrix longispora TaxID=33920 RepID=A0ABU1PSP5_9PSEU|nr:ATP-binding protein [Saccharothrix longispora]MDR6593673.1 putative kinase [Saccharothrix longispora]
MAGNRISRSRTRYAIECEITYCKHRVPPCDSTSGAATLVKTVEEITDQGPGMGSGTSQPQLHAPPTRYRLGKDRSETASAMPHQRHGRTSEHAIGDDTAPARPEHERGRPTLFLTVGLPATGKTTAARRLEVEHNALRLTKDEWVKALYGPENPSSASDVIEGLLIGIGLRALELGDNVVIDYGLWSRDERSALRQAAADRGARVAMHYFEVPPAEQRRRLDRRQADEPGTTWPMRDEELADWARIIEVPTRGELDGSEPIDDPPAGFTSWDEWRGHRWPPAVS